MRRVRCLNHSLLVKGKEESEQFTFDFSFLWPKVLMPVCRSPGFVSLFNVVLGGMVVARVSHEAVSERSEDGGLDSGVGVKSYKPFTASSDIMYWYADWYNSFPVFQAGRDVFGVMHSSFFIVAEMFSSVSLAWRSRRAAKWEGNWFWSLRSHGRCSCN